MKLSHSKLSLALSDPMSYYLRYKIGISEIETKPAFSLGSAVHYCLENSTTDLSEYYGKDHAFTDEWCLAEAMATGFMSIKDDVFNEILTNKYNGDKATILPNGEQHELKLYAPLKSFIHPEESHLFEGIIDLLLLTDRGFIIIDWKTSSVKPDWNGYLEQIYRYIFICRTLWPKIPIYKIGIVNLRKTKCKIGAKETVLEWRKRMQKTYLDTPYNFFFVHTWEPEDLDQRLFNDYIENLSHQADAAELIDKNNSFYINYGAQVSKYGQAAYYKIFYKVDDAYTFYNIRDKILNEDNELVDGKRPCIKLDMACVFDSLVLNKYDKFKEAFMNFYNEEKSVDKQQFFVWLQERYHVDIDLLNTYWSYFCIELSKNKK